MIDLSTIRQELAGAIAATDAAVHVRAFSGWVLGDIDRLSQEVSRASAASENNMLSEQVATLGYGNACGLLDGRAMEYGDDMSAIWVPEARQRRTER